jgi:hypothetical protein
LNNPAAIANFAHASIPQGLPTAVATVTLAYGAAPVHKYFLGAATGGREALQQVQHYFDNYDGVIALVPVIDYTGIVQRITQIQQAAHANNNAGWTDATEITLYQNAQLAACDAQDGLADRVVATFRRARLGRMTRFSQWTLPSRPTAPPPFDRAKTNLWPDSLVHIPI